LGLIEHECNRPARYREAVLTSWARPYRNAASAPDHNRWKIVEAIFIGWLRIEVAENLDDQLEKESCFIAD
jgi:hypothetical protein